MKLPQGLTERQMESTWASMIEPVISNEINQGHMLTGVVLQSGVNVVNHGLSRKLIGWFIVGINAAATVYDTQATNQMPQLTLNLTSNAACSVNLWVF